MLNRSIALVALLSLTAPAAASETAAQPTAVQPMRKQMNVKYRTSGKNTWSGKPGTLRLSLFRTFHVDALRGIVKDAELSKGTEVKIHIRKFDGTTRLSVNGDNAEVRRVEKLVLERTKPQNEYTDRIVDKAPER
jgi:hypothetical protein